MKKCLIIAVALFSMCSSVGYAQKKTDNTYKLQKAYEVLENDSDLDQALELLGEQIMDTPKNVEAYLLRVKIFRNKKEFANALSDLNAAIRINDRKNDIKISSLHWWKATIYMDIDEYEKASDSYRTALSIARKDNKDNVQNISFDYAQALFMLKKYDEADAIYRQMLREDETDQAALVGIARNMFERENYSEIFPLLKKCQKLDADYSEVYRFFAYAYDKLGETDKAIDNGFTWFEKDEDADLEFLTKIALKHKSYAVAKAREKVKKSENPAQWRALLISIYEKACDYEQAVKEYDALEAEFGKDAFIYIHRAENYSELGLTEFALADIEQALGGDDDHMAYCTKGNICRAAAMYKEAIAAYSEAIELEPMNAWGYYARGWSYELSGDEEKAMEDYNLGIDLDKSYPYIFLMRGTLLRKQGKTEAAKDDFERVLQLDTIANGNSCAMYALHFLGRNDEAEAWMQRMIDDNPLYCGSYYDKACLYARMGKLDESVAALELALKRGYCSFAHIEHDDDMDPIRDRDDFKALIKKYSAKLEERIKGLKDMVIEERETSITEVAINRHPGGTFEIPCTVNGLSLKMIFDTGASDVTISSVEANFMLKNGQLSSKDIKGKNHYMTASGDIHEGTVITLKEVKVGDAILHNVDASVVKNQKAPLLLGQSVLEKFGTITIDNINNKLIIKH